MSPLRPLLRNPSYTLVSVATLALAVGANLVVFSLVNALWLRPPPIPDPDRVFLLSGDLVARAKGPDAPDQSRYSEGRLASFRQSGAFEGVAGQVLTSSEFLGNAPRFTLVGGEGSLEALWVTPDYFSTLGLTLSGPGFEHIADGMAAAPVIISDRLWRGMLGGRSDVLGLQLPAQPIPLDVVGVAPPGFRGARRGERADLWLPHVLLPRLTGAGLTDPRFIVMPMVTFARLRPGITATQARAIVGRDGRTPPTLTPLGDVFGASDVPMVRVHGGDLMWVAAVTAAFVLAGGCATLMALVLVHYERRSQELAIRAALGATRARLVAQLGLELLAITLIGSAAAVLVSAGALRVLPRTILPGGVDLERLDLTVDWRVLAAAVLVCVVVLVLAAAAPVQWFTRPKAGLNGISPASTRGPASLRFRRLVLTVHVGATAVVLIAAALFVQSVTRAFAVGPGFDPARVIFASIHTRYHSAALDEATLDTRISRDVATTSDVIERIRALPGVEIVALGASPIGREMTDRTMQPKTLAVETGELDTTFGWLPAGRNYLEALGVPLLGGRAGTEREGVITPALAADLWPGESPLGKRVAFGQTPMTIVGIADPAFGSVRLGRSRGIIYFGDSTVPIAIRAAGIVELTIRAHDVESVVAPLERLLSQAFPDAPLVRVTTGERLQALDLGRERLAATMFSGFGLVALVLAIVSLVGLVAYAVESRWREFAVRMALGASRSDVARLAIWVGLEPALVGAASGVVASIALSRTIDSFLVGMIGVSVPTYAGVAALLIGSALVAGGVGARKLRQVSLADSLKGS